MPVSYRSLSQVSGLDVEQEGTRRIIAYVAIGAYFLLLALLLVVGWMILRIQVEEVLKVVTTTAGIIGGVVGAVVGFYFRGES